jgi:hypothetical protein
VSLVLCDVSMGRSDILVVPEGEGTTVLRNVENYLPKDKPQHLRRSGSYILDGGEIWRPFEDRYCYKV